MRQNPPFCIDNCRYAGIGGPDQRKALLDRTQAGLPEMLVGARRVSEPRVVRHVQEKGRASVLRGRDARKDGLVTNQRQEGGTGLRR